MWAHLRELGALNYDLILKPVATEMRPPPVAIDFYV
jgi:hypothetical protein